MAASVSVEKVLESYPVDAREQLSIIRQLIYDTASREDLGEVTEAIKWGEPSYSVKKGSPIRMAWKSKFPTQVSLFFNCQTTLVETFREVHGESLSFVDNREVVLPIGAAMPTKVLESCISMALRYHSIKHLPLLGA